MAFATALVLAAQTGPSAELIHQTVTTGSAGGWTHNITLPSGQWLVVARCRYSGVSLSYSSSVRIRIDGVERFTSSLNTTESEGACAYPTAAAIVTGGRTVPIAMTSARGSLGWDFWAARTS